METADIGLVVSGLMFGGGQRVVLDLADRATGGGVKVCVVLLGAASDKFDQFAPKIVPYDGRYNHPWSIARTAWELRRAARDSGVRLVHSHGWDADIIGWLASTGLRIPQVMHIHVTSDWLESRAVRHRIRRWMTRLALGRRGVRMVAVSDAVRRHWALGLGVEPDRIRVVRNGIDVIRYQPSERSRESLIPVIGVAARLAPMKGIEHLLDALGVLAEQGVAFQLKIAGTGNLRNPLEERCARTGIGERTEFLGHVDDMPSFYRSIDLYVLPSVSTEGLPLGVLEAMASGIPVVATTVGGTPEAVRDGVDGLLVPPRDVSALADALRRLLSDTAGRRTMGEAGRTRAVETFSLERFSDEIFDLYHEILEERRA